jgi:hypothetical protein
MVRCRLLLGEDDGGARVSFKKGLSLKSGKILGNFVTTPKNGPKVTEAKPTFGQNLAEPPGGIVVSRKTWE